MPEYIDRDQAIDTVKFYDGDPDGIPWAIRSLKDIPAADVRPVVRGKWIPVTNGRGGHECDQCHAYAPSYPTGEERLSYFCPNCGADMIGEKDDKTENT